jgi:hypothetical protein
MIMKTTIFTTQTSKMPRLFLPKTAAALLALLAVAAAPVYAQTTITWDGGASTTSWNDGDNWNPNGVPVGSNTTSNASPYPANMVNAILPNLTTAYTVAYSGTAGLVNNLTITNATMNVSDEFSVLGPNSTTAYGNTTLNTATLNIAANAEYTSSSLLSASAGSTVDVASGAMFRLNTRTNATNTLNTGSVLNVSGDMLISRAQNIQIRESNDTNGSTTLTVSGGTLESPLFGGVRGNISLGQSSTASTANTLNVANSGTVTVGTMNLGASLATSATTGGINHNTMNLSSGTVTLQNNLILARPGAVNGAHNNAERASTNTVNISGGAMSVGLDMSVGVGRVGIVNLSGGALSTGDDADVLVGGFITGLITPTTAAHSGAVNVTGGSLTVGDGGVIKIASSILENSTQTYAGFSTAGSLNVSDGTVTAGGLTAGGFNSAYATPATINPGTVSVSGGSLTISGTINLAGTVIATGAQAGFTTPGILNITGGTVSAGSLLVENSSGSVNFSGGHLISASTTINTGSAFQVGDGVGAAGSANYQMNGGTHTFAHGLIIASDGKLTGFGTTTAALSGSGSINPGNSPGIITAPSVDPSGGLGFNLEFTSVNASPIYGNASASGNDVLRLTALNPFAASLDGTNTVSLWLDAPAISLGDSFRGGFYTDAGDFLTSFENANFLFYVRGDGNGSHEYSDTFYYTLSEYNTASSNTFSIAIGTLQDTANFGAGNIDGYVSTFHVIPEPRAIFLVGLALFGWCFSRKHRHA